MLSSVTAFLNSLKENDSRLFDQDLNHDAIKITLAIFINSIIHADGNVTAPEYKNSLSFFQNEFNLDEIQTHELFDSIHENTQEYGSCLKALKEALLHNPYVKVKVMEHINHIITCDGCKDIEYDVFNRIKASIL